MKQKHAVRTPYIRLDIYRRRLIIAAIAGWAFGIVGGLLIGVVI